MQNEIKICRSLDEYENPIWRLPNGKKLDLYTRNSTGNFRAKAVDSKGVDRQVIVVDDVQDRHAVIYLDEHTLDQIHDIIWLRLDPESEEYLTERSYMVGVSKMIDIRTGLPAGIPAEGMDVEYLTSIKPSFERAASMSEVFTHPPEFVTGLQEVVPKMMIVPDEDQDFKPSCEVGCSKGAHLIGTKCERCGTPIVAITGNPSTMSLFKLVGAAVVASGEEPDRQQVPVTWRELRTWYTDERYEVVYQGLYERTMLHINALWPWVVSMNKAHELATAILSDLTDQSGDAYSDHLQHLLQSIGMANNPTWELIRNMQSVMGRVLITGPIQTPWERGEELCWNV